MTKRKGSPTLQLSITEAQHARAVKSNSGGCLIADAIKEQYPHLSGIVVDMATIRVSDRSKGLRYTYLTPAAAQHVLLSFDQGWRNPIDQLTLKQAVKIDKITMSPSSREKTAEHREARIAELQEKLDLGEDLTPVEKRSLSRMTNPNRKPPVERPSSVGPVTDVLNTRGGGPATVVGGPRRIQGEPHPNLLRGRNRHFGARLANPGQAFQDAVDQTIAALKLEGFDQPSQTPES